MTREWAEPASTDEQEPTINLRSNASAREVLENILSEHDLELVENPSSTVAEVVRTGQRLTEIDASPLKMEMAVPVPGGDSNGIIPVISLIAVPVANAFDSFFRMANLRFALDPKINNTDYPPLTLHWTHLTAKQAILAICEHYDLVMSVDDATGAIHIAPAPVKKHHHLLLK